MAIQHHHHAAHVVHAPNVARDANVQTVVSIVYVTASPTFDGPIGGYVTLSPSAGTLATSTDSSASSDVASSTSTSTVAQEDTTTASTTKSSVSASIPVRSHRPGQSSSTAGTDAAESSSSATFYSSSVATTTFATSVVPASSTLSTQSSAGLVTASSSALVVAAASKVSSSASSKITTITLGTPLQNSHAVTSGGKAGIAIGVLLAAAAIIGIAIFLFRRKQNKAYLESDGDHFNEKRLSSPGLPQDSGFSIRHSILRVPRLSLGPLTSVFPSMTERSVANNSVQDLADPFGDHAATGIINEKNHPMLPNVGPLAEAAVPKPLSIKSDRSGQGSPAASPARAGKPSNVHRVHLEFKPSMDDELELRPGQLVRMLHEYDDGWTLCIRMDRSQQGVAPRQCLSKHALKPRPAGPNAQRTSPNNRSSMNSYISTDSAPAAQSPTPNRARAESSGSYLGQDRPKSPVMGNDQPIAELDARQRSNSAGHYLNAIQFTPVNGAISSPLNPGNLSRKPLPGQAL